MKNYVLLVFFWLGLTTSMFAGDPLIWTVSERADVTRGEARGVSIDDSGRISMAPKLAEVFKTEQPYVWSGAVDAAGNVYLGTGSEGRIYKVDPTGKGSLFADLPELNVATLAIGAKGEIFAATLPDGKVYQLAADGKFTVFFDPKEKYIWSLAVMSDGSLAVGTGESGKIYKVRTSGQTPEASLLVDTTEAHIISLAADRAGNLFAGTDAGGLVLKIAPGAKPFAILDSPLREIHELAVGADGSVYALALAESVTAKPEAPTDAKPETKVMTVEKPTAIPTDPPRVSRFDLTNSKSVVYRLSADGAGSNVIWNSSSIVAFSLAADKNGVLVGTADKGRVYAVSNDARETLLVQTDEGQISALLPTASGKTFAASSNQGKLYSFGGNSAAGTEGIYESPVLDSKNGAAWGRIWWTGSGVKLQSRSGNTEKPNETWSDWSAAYEDPKGASVTSPAARYLQWRAVFVPGGSLSEVSVAFLDRNIAPEVSTLQVLPTNIGLAANPPMPVDPNIELSGLDPVLFGIMVPPPTARRLYQRGAKSFQWTAEDRNGDKLIYDVYLRELGETNFRLLKADLTDPFLTIDGQSLADGRYVVRVVVRDSPSNPTALALSGERISDAFDIDNSAPVVTPGAAPQLNGDKARFQFSATEASSYLSRAEYSVNGGEWREVFADDGISDSARERYTVEIPVAGAGEYAVTLRVFDANGNSGTARAVFRK